MIFLSALRKYWFSDGRDDPVSGANSHDDDGQLPIAGYSSFDRTDLLAELSKHSQSELEAAEVYERSHKQREAVFNKLHYLRGPEPLKDYDALGTPQISAALKGAEVETIKRVRVYERKFQHRPDVLEEVDDILREGRPSSVHRDPPRVTTHE